MSEERRRPPRIGEGIRAGIGILTAFKEAVEETFQEAVDRGELKPERAKQAVQDAMRRAQGAVDDVRERLDTAPRRELEELRAEVEELKRRLAALEGERGGEGPVAGTLPGPE